MLLQTGVKAFKNEKNQMKQNTHEKSMKPMLY